MIRINLLPVRAARKKEVGRQQLVLIAASVVAIVAANAWWSHARSSELEKRNAKLARTRAEIAQLEKIIGEVTHIKAQQAAVKDKLAVLDKLKTGRQGPVRMLEELSSVAPKRLWMRKFDEKGSAATVEGTAASIDDVSSLLGAMKRSPYFANVELKKTTARADGKLKLVDFSVTLNVNYTPAAPTVAAAALAPAHP